VLAGFGAISWTIFILSIVVRIGWDIYIQIRNRDTNADELAKSSPTDQSSDTEDQETINFEVKEEHATTKTEFVDADPVESDMQLLAVKSDEEPFETRFQNTTTTRHVSIEEISANCVVDCGLVEYAKRRDTDKKGSLSREQLKALENKRQADRNVDQRSDYAKWKNLSKGGSLSREQLKALKSKSKSVLI